MKLHPRTLAAFAALLFGFSPTQAAVDHKDFAMHSDSFVVSDDPSHPNKDRGLWYYKRFVAKRDAKLGRIRVSKGDTLIGVSTSDFLGAEPKRDHWIIRPIFSEINFAHAGIALVRKPGDPTLSRLDVRTGKLTPTPFLQLIYAASTLDLHNYHLGQPGTYGFRRLVSVQGAPSGDYTFVDGNFQPIVTIHQVVAFHGLQGGALAIEHQTPEGKVLVTYNSKGEPLIPPLSDYLLVYGQTGSGSRSYKVCLLPVDAEAGIYWPLAPNGTQMPAPEGLIGIKPILEKIPGRNPPKEPRVIEAAVLWDTPQGALYAFIPEALTDLKTILASRSQARWAAFRDAEDTLKDTNFDNVRRSPARLVQDGDGNVFIVPVRQRMPDRQRFPEGLHALFDDLPFRNWEAANRSIAAHNHSIGTRAWNASVEARKRREAEAEEQRRAGRAAAEKAAIERQVRDDALLHRVEEAIKARRLDRITYDDLREAYRATPSSARKKALEEAWERKQAAEPRPVVVASSSGSGGYRYNPGNTSSANNAAVNASIERHNARMQEMAWRHKMENFQAGRGFTSPGSR